MSQDTKKEEGPYAVGAWPVLTRTSEGKFRHPPKGGFLGTLIKHQ